MKSSRGIPLPDDEMIATFFLVVRDPAASASFYEKLGGNVERNAGPTVIRFAGAWLILNEGGGPTPDKPTTTLVPPEGIARTDAFLNLRVADIAKVHREWSAMGVRFLSEPLPNGDEIRCYALDPDEHLIEVGQTLDPVPDAE